MSYIASIVVVVQSDSGTYETQRVEAEGETRNEALENLRNACMGVNVIAPIMSTLQDTRKGK
jgi:hypothetical protein